jgi:signal transduction histidine kinase
MTPSKTPPTRTPQRGHHGINSQQPPKFRAFDSLMLFSAVGNLLQNAFKFTQQVRVEVSEDAGRSYRTVLNQEYAFSSRGATFQREDIRLQLSTVTHVRLTIVLNKGGIGKATLTSLHLWSRKNARRAMEYRTS